MGRTPKRREHRVVAAEGSRHQGLARWLGGAGSASTARRCALPESERLRWWAAPCREDWVGSARQVEGRDRRGLRRSLLGRTDKTRIGDSTHVCHTCDASTTSAPPSPTSTRRRRGRTRALRRGLRSGPIVHSERRALFAVAGALRRARQGMFVELVPHARVALGAGTSSGRTPRGAGHPADKVDQHLGGMTWTPHASLTS